MPIYDKIKPLQENPLCPNCAQETDFISRNRNHDGTYQALLYECPSCHFRIGFTTRNNRRMDWAIIGALYGGFTGLAVGVIVAGVTLARTALTRTP